MENKEPSLEFILEAKSADINELNLEIEALEKQKADIQQSINEKQIIIDRENSFIKGVQAALRNSGTSLTSSEEKPRTRAKYILDPDVRGGKIERFLHKLGRPATIDEILTGIKEDKSKRNPLQATLHKYAKDSKVFKKAGKGMFDLI